MFLFSLSLSPRCLLALSAALLYTAAEQRLAVGSVCVDERVW